MAKNNAGRKQGHQQVMTTPVKGSAHGTIGVTPPGTTGSKPPSAGPMSPNMGKGILPKGKC